MAKDSNKKQKSNKSSKKTNKNSFRWLLWLIVAGLVAISFHYLDGYNSPGLINNKSQADTDFREKTKKIHKIVDQVLSEYKDNNLAVKDYDKEVTKENDEGKILWHNRQLFLKFDHSKLDDLKNKLQQALKKEDAQILDVSDDNYEGQDIKRIDIGIKDKLNNDDLRIISDKIYLLTIGGKAKATLKQDFTAKGKLALVIDDFGYNQESINIYQQIDRPLTFAILPNQTFSKKAVVQAANNQREFILHLPMEAGAEAAVEPKTINVDMSAGEINALVTELLNTIPEIIGVNNHQGSKATADERVMKDVLKVLKERNLFFIDSKTSGASVAYKMALKMNVPTAENSVFIDNSSDINYIKKQLRLAAKMGLENGSVIAIGHARINTGKAIKEVIPELEAMGIQLVYASELLQ